MEAKSEAEKALAAHKKEEATLEKTKVKHQNDVKEFEDALTTADADSPPPSKEIKKLVAVLKSISATASLVNAAPNAIGKKAGFEIVVINEVKKALTNKLDELNTLLGQWDQHVAQMAQQNTEKSNAVQACRMRWLSARPSTSRRRRWRATRRLRRRRRTRRRPRRPRPARRATRR